jgi:hypothetical protein
MCVGCGTAVPAREHDDAPPENARGTRMYLTALANLLFSGDVAGGISGRSTSAASRR